MPYRLFFSVVVASACLQVGSSSLQSLLGLRPFPLGARVHPAEKCTGEPADETFFPLDGGCHKIQGVMGMTEEYQGSCNSTVIDLKLFMYSKGFCTGWVTPWPQAAGVCVAGLRGQPQIMTCNGHSFTRKLWSLAPAVPRNLRCTGATAQTLQTFCEVDPSLVDEVAFEVSLPFARSSLSYTAQVRSGSGSIMTTIPGLRPGTSHKVRVRAHLRGESEGNPAAWSVLSPEEACTTLAEDKEELDTLSHGASHWLEVFRVANGAGLPDFLDQHNAADLVGLASYLLDGEPKPITRYCVEVLSVSLPHATADAGAAVSSYAEFASCNVGECVCMHQNDRAIARQPREEIMSSCHFPAADDLQNTCRCSAKSGELSRQYVGRTRIQFPMCFATNLLKENFTLPREYPALIDPAAPVGHWFSFPSPGRCSLGTRPGNGACTWQLAPLSHTVMSAKTSAHIPDMSKEYTCLDTGNLLSTIETIRKAFSRLDLPPCGSEASPSLQSRSAMSLVV
ncbi:unnamed protein product [Polarella glacialis]|uniref:Fibronectin type-III domain-containing protein n=1 Tax=Polarella glacialis TaxID=89957 RepID=A0A813HUD0_POLGL|nr:unnamed protein product [Polarella glacialis]